MSVSPNPATITPSMPHAALSDPAIRDRYQVLDTIAPGDEDALYLARRIDTGELIDLRVLSGRLGGDRVLVTALTQQATLVARVSGECAGIATVHACERTSNGLALAMERPEGETLRDIIKREGALDLKRALVLGVRLAEVLEAVHNLGLVHGGLRPENVVLVGPEERVVLKHFGFDWVFIARSPDTGPHRESGRADHTYQAPEQAWEQATHRSDVYAFGAILYEMLAGAPVSPPSRLRAYLPLEHCRVDIPPGVERIVTQALQVAPERRHMDMSAVCNALVEQLASERRSPLSEPVTKRGAGAREGMKVLAWSGAATLMLLTLGLAVSVTVDRVSWIPGTQILQPKPADLGEAMGDGAPPPQRPLADGDSDRPRNGALAAGTTTDPSAPPRQSLPPRVDVRAKPVESPPPRPIESSTASATERRETPATPPPQSSPEARDDTANDPGAIIDWLLNEGAGKDR